MIDTLQLAVSRTTFYRTLKEHGIINWIAKKRPLLTEEHAAKRLAFALKYRDWTYEEWSRVIWSDECSITRGSGTKREWVFRTPKEKWHRAYITPEMKGKDISVMIWAAIFGDQQSDIYLLNRDFESEKHGYSAKSYIEVLKEMILTI